MTTTGAPTTTDSDSIAVAVRKELRELRLRVGLTREKVKEAHAIQGLLTVDKELSRRPAFDRAEAAYQVIICAATVGVRDLDLRRILRVTLNIPNNEHAGWLDERRDRLRRGWPYTKNAYNAKERVAYGELCGVLLSAERSPCDEPEPLSLTEILIQFSVGPKEIRMPLAEVVRLRHLLLALDSETDEATRTLIAEAILTLLPSLAQHQDSSPLDFLLRRVIPAVVLLYGWTFDNRPIRHLLDLDTLLRALRNRRGLITIMFPLDPEVVYNANDWDEEAWVDNQIGVVWNGKSWSPLFRLSDNGEDDGVRYHSSFTQLSWDAPAMRRRHSTYRSKYYAALKNAIDLLSELIVEAEHHNKWADIFRKWKGP